MKLRDVPPPTYAFGYQRLPRSGNEINGLGGREKRMAKVVFHNTPGHPPIEWQALDRFQKMTSGWGFVWERVRTLWMFRNAVGPVARQRRRIDDPAAMSRWIKEQARAIGDCVVGVAELAEEDCYEGYPLPYRYGICIGAPMDREEMVHVPNRRAGYEVIRTYTRVARIALGLAKKIRSLGYPAQAYRHDVVMIPLGIRAGIGELGKHGSMICKEYGSNFRLAVVLTDMPLAIDSPIDIGVDDLCLRCTRCTTDCPPGAIADTKQLVRGATKWYVNFDKCVPYFAKTEGCAICIEVCPWSEPGRGTTLSAQLLAKRAARGTPLKVDVAAE